VATALLIAYVTNRTIGLYLVHGIFGNYPLPSLILFKINIFMAGMCLANAYLERTTDRFRRWLLLGFFSLLGARLLVILCALFMVGILFTGLDRKGLVKRTLSGRTVKFFGDTSYSAYLLHSLMIPPILFLLFRQFWFLELPVSGRFLVALASAGLPLYIISYVLFLFIELPTIRLGRKVAECQRQVKPAIESETVLSCAKDGVVL